MMADERHIATANDCLCDTHIIHMEGVNLLFPVFKNSSIEVLRNFDLKIERHKTVAIVGPSGCGKTSILRLLASLTNVTSGSVLIDGLKPAEALRKKLVSMMFQKTVLLPWLTADENVTLAGKLFDQQTVCLQAQRLLCDVGLKGFEQLYPNQLSGGMKSRAALARAISFQPRILLLDEPFSSLDDLTRNSMHEILLGLLSVTLATVVIVTHNIEEAIYLSDRVLVLSSRPAVIKGDFQISLKKPRNSQIRRDSEFYQLKEKIEKLVLE